MYQFTKIFLKPGVYLTGSAAGGHLEVIQVTDCGYINDKIARCTWIDGLYLAGISVSWAAWVSLRYAV